jgi:multiple sugar transport system permease protein
MRAARVAVQVRRRLGSVLLHVIVIALGFFYALPFLWLLSTSLKTGEQAWAVPPVWIPNPIVLRNYPDALAYIPYFQFFVNTMRIAVPSAVGAVVSNAIVAYGFSRIRWRFRDAFFFVCISTMMIPYAVTMVPVFIVFKQLGWVGTYRPLIIPSFFGAPFYIFLLRQFFLTIPLELSDAATVDGCSEFEILWRIILPLSKPALAVVALFDFMWSWNDYLGPLIYLARENQFTIAVGLAHYVGVLGQRLETWTWLMAASTVTILPILVLFFLSQRTFIEGVTLTGLKG